MSAEPPADRDPAGAFRSLWYRVVLLFLAAYLTVLWGVLGPSNPWYALMVAWGTCSLQPAMGAVIAGRTPRRWFRVPPGERVLHRIAGVGIFGRLLEVSGYNGRIVDPLRRFSGTRAGLFSLEQNVRAGGITHGICFAIHVVLALLALFGRDPWKGALWMLLPAVVVHLYPVLLQRSILLRLQPLLDKTGSADWVAR